MKNQLVKFIVNIMLICCFVGICINTSTHFQNQITAVACNLVKMSAPELIVGKNKNNDNDNDKNDDTTIKDSTTQKAKITSTKSTSKVNNTTTSSEKSSQVMKRISSKDSNDDSDFIKTPADVAKLMTQAKKSTDKSDYVGKTSEEAYQGGGTIIAYGKMQIQSKIPFSYYKPNIKQLLSDGADLSIDDKLKPTILIYHSHTTESYNLLDEGYYVSPDARSKDNNKNVVRVGDEIVKYLEQAGFNVIHDTTIHDTDYNDSYNDSRKTVEKYLEQYPSIDITIDVHRDDITYSNKTKVKPTIKVDGKKAARMMIISGCEYGSITNFPDWEDNLKFNVAIQNKMNTMFNGVMRPILFSERKYNMFETHNSFLLEVGTDANTLDEACYSGRMFGKALGELLNDNYVTKK